tara:strand:+ start:307 stop:942 length:636 start_codon:yes stop_codon:yes gene_type:complete
MKIGVVMFYDDNVKMYGDINYKINKKYCEKYNLTLIVSNKKKYTNRQPSWEKLPLLLDNISNFDYIIWIDADAFFYYDANNITNIINDNLSANFIFSKDIGNNRINCGFFIIKNTDYSIKFLKKWAYDELLYKKFKDHPWWEQAALVNLWHNNILNIKENSIRINYGILQHFRKNDKLIGTYVYHLAGTSKKIRYKTSQDYLNKLIVKSAA